VSFGVWSPEAEAVWLCLFDDQGEREESRWALHPSPQGVWHGRLSGAAAGLVYGYRASGTWAPEQGLRFNPQRVLLDPYAHEIVGAYGGDLEAFLDHDPQHPGRPHPHDNAAVALKARVSEAVLAPKLSRSPPAHRVIAEVHVKTATALHPEVPEALRGTYAGLAHPALIAHWKQLGVTTLELLPLQQRADEARLQALGLPNHWGYSTIGYFAAEPRYASEAGTHGDTHRSALSHASASAELRAAIASLRQAGFEVVLDVVFNHTAETDLAGPCLSFKGLAHRHWYRTEPGERGRLRDWTGCGNTLNFAEPMVVRFVVDALRHWVESYGIDGFRFDLAPCLARDEAGQFAHGAPLFAAIQTDPVLRQVLCIAEPWDMGPGAHQLGQFPPGWLEWNDQARDTFRAYWLAPDDARARRADLARRLAGSSDRFCNEPRRPRRPSASLNFITAHDGYTLRDLVSYQQRHNLANGEGNRDGHGDNLSWNVGVEGPSHDLEVARARARLQRSLLATLMLARGTPMLLMGDELGHSQSGNNNAYCQDNGLTWLAWPSEASALCRFVARLAELRAADPAFHADLWLQGRPGADGLPDVRWACASGQGLSAEDWHDRHERALQVHFAPPGARHETLVWLNPGHQPRPFHLPPVHRGAAWHRVLDTAQPDGAPADPSPQSPAGGPWLVPEHCLQVWRSQAWPLPDPQNFTRGD
jgi:glycogen operon protein